jgi:hypothetical protein
MPDILDFDNRDFKVYHIYPHRDLTINDDMEYVDLNDDDVYCNASINNKELISD